MDSQEVGWCVKIGLGISVIDVTFIFVTDWVRVLIGW
jgi:hypothetical protein